MIIAYISIHAPREGSDGVSPGVKLHLGISIHAPREGSDHPPAGRPHEEGRDFYPRSPRGERPYPITLLAIAITISIHAPREGSDAVIQSDFL